MSPSQAPFYLIVHTDHPLDPTGPNSGAEMASLNHARFLAKAGRRVCLAARLKQNLSHDQGVDFIDLGPTYDIERAFDYADSLGHPYVMISEGKAFALLLSRRRTLCIKRILVTHDRTAGDSGLRPEVLETVCDHILCVSQAQYDKLASEGAPTSKMQVIYNGVDLSIFRPSAPEAHNPYRLLFSGALVPDKGLHLLIGSYIDLKARYPQLTLEVFGSSSLWSRSDYLNINELQAAVPGLTFRGKATQSEIASALHTAGICVVPSIWFEPLGLVSLEAQATGTPVVTFNVGGLPETVIDGETGFVAKEVSQPALTAALDSLLKDPQRLAQMSAKASAHVSEKFNWSVVIERILRCAEGV